MLLGHRVKHAARRGALALEHVEELLLGARGTDGLRRGVGRAGSEAGAAGAGGAGGLFHVDTLHAFERRWPNDASFSPSPPALLPHDLVDLSVRAQHVQLPRRVLAERLNGANARHAPVS